MNSAFGLSNYALVSFIMKIITPAQAMTKTVTKTIRKIAIKTVVKAPVRPAKTDRPDRKYDILLAAEKLFAQRGFSAVSIRDIANEAGVQLALVGYYYGQKKDLYHAIFEHWATVINERVQSLQQAVDAPSGDKLERVVTAFIEPVIRLRNSTEGEYYALLMSRGLSQQSSDDDAVIREFFDPLAKAFISALHKLLKAEFPGTTQGNVAWCYQFMLGCLLHHITDNRVVRLSNQKNQSHGPEATPLLINFVVCGIRGALTPRPAPKL